MALHRVHESAASLAYGAAAGRAEPNSTGPVGQVRVLEALQMADEGDHLGAFVEDGLRTLGQTVLAHWLSGKVGQHHHRPPRHGSDRLLEQGQSVARLQAGFEYQHIPAVGMGPQPVVGRLFGQGGGHTVTHAQIDKGFRESLQQFGASVDDEETQAQDKGYPGVVEQCATSRSMSASRTRAQNSKSQPKVVTK